MSIQIEAPGRDRDEAVHMAGMTAQPTTATPTGAETTSSLDRYLAEITDPVLRENLAREIGGMQRQFGLVFERHHPEGIRLPKHAVKRGSKVVISSANGKPRKDSVFYRVHKLNRASENGQSSTAVIVDAEGNEATHPVSELTVAKEFGDVMYPGLKKLSEVRNGDPAAPVHTVINGENYHALEALQYTHAGKIDLIYIDPPYNTGNADWKYNDRYVDSKDGYRHSKWLSFMEKRLLIAKKLLTPTGVIIMAIDDNEHHRLRMLADEVLGESNFISNVVWQGGRKNDSRFISNGADYMLVYANNRELMIESGLKWRERRDGTEIVITAGVQCWNGAAAELFEIREADWWQQFYLPLFETGDPTVGGNSPGEMYARWCNSRGFQFSQDIRELATKKLKAWWRALPPTHPAKAFKHFSNVDEFGRVYFPDNTSAPDSPETRSHRPIAHPGTGISCPVPAKGWRYSDETMDRLLSEGSIHFGADHTRGLNRKSYLDSGDGLVPESAFTQDRRASAQHLASVLGDKRFPFPKDHEVLMRWLAITAPKDAVILDFFGGSGTTAEAVIRLNSEDGGTRQAILVTNNELAKTDDTKLRKAGHKPGDEEYEALGVFHHVTKPRLETVVTGTRQDGSKYSDGLEANVAFFELTYLDEPEIVTGLAFNDLAGLFWLKAGGLGGTVEMTSGAKADGFAISESGSTAVLFSPGRARALAEKMDSAERAISHLFIVTDSEAQGDEAATHFPGGITVERIYGSYLEAFQVNRKD